MTGNRTQVQLKTLAKWIHKLTVNVTVFQKQPGHTDSAYSS
jgi:succinylglutamate desuccinylase